MIYPKDYKILKANGLQGIHDFEGEDFYEFQLRITDYCNYDCSYCHWKYGHHYNFEDIKKTISIALKNINHKNYRIYFHGGEPTTHPKCRDIIEYIFSFNKNIIVEFQTNLSVGEKYIKSLLDRFKHNKLEINISYHDKFVKDFDKLLKKIDMLHENNVLGKIDIMLEHDKTQVDNIIKNSKKLLNKDYSKRVELIHGFIDYDDSTNYYKDLMEEYKEHMFNENYEVTHSNGDVKIYNTNDFYSEGISFKGWTCSVGKKYIIINGDGNYFMCCANTLTLPSGNLLKNEKIFNFKVNNYTKCKWDCCKGEFYVEKFK